MRSVLVVALLTLITLVGGSSAAQALSARQKQVIDSGASYFNVEEDACVGGSSLVTPNEGSVPSGAKVYILGDSITNQSRTQIETEFTQSDLKIISINADPGRAISTDTAGGNPSGIEAVNADASLIAEAEVVVVALGTNSGTEDLNVQIPALISAIKSKKDSVVIFWVNLFYTSGGNETRNSVIATHATTSGYRVIDTASAGIELGSDKTHPTAAGSATFAKTIATGIKSGGSTATSATSSTGSYDPLSLTFPAFPDENKIASAITSYIRERRPSSPWFTVDNDIGTWLVRESKTRNINPLLILSIGKQENNFGSGTDVHVAQYYNYFGMKGSGPVVIPNSKYRGFSSASEGILFFMDKVKSNTQSSERGSYKDVVNFYDYLGVHQSGSITYPGEPLDPNDQTGPGGVPDGDKQNGWDEAMKVYTSWDPHKNDGPPTAEEHRGQIYNPGIYYKNSIALINTITEMTLSDIPSRGGSGVVSNCASGGGSSGGGSGKVDGRGYSFPLAPQTQFIGGIEVGQTVTKHSDGTPAFDLFSTDSAAVYAIGDGVVTNLQTDYKGIAGCSSIQLKTSDGFYYWYGHLKNPTVQDNDSVKAGDKMAELADKANFNGECYGSAPHLHIDRGCVINGEPQTGGRDECRDPDFIPFLSSLYAELPNN